jgi:hypothetical protein
MHLYKLLAIVAFAVAFVVIGILAGRDMAGGGC